jgi:arylsulfatase A-like enzyme
MVNRRNFLRTAAVSVITLSFPKTLLSKCKGTDKPNIILCMADDMGWGDPGFNGNKIIKTSNLDTMAKAGMRFTRFYSGAPVCSPTRGSCLTGRHPYRYGIFSANSGHLPKEEITLAEALKTQGYTTGHFGKWHLGTLLPDYSGKGPKREPEKNYMTPAMSGFDEWFSTEYAVATWDPYNPEFFHGKKNEYDIRALYWHNGKNITEGLQGDDSKIIMDKVVPFIHKSAKNSKPFFAVIWFHAPHAPVVGGPKYRRMYSQYSEDQQHYYGCITALDEQVGRLRNELRKLGIADNTMLWFCSDNGPEGKDGKTGRHRGSAGPFRGRKRSLLEGGVRVPGLLEWPARIKVGQVTDIPCSTSDYFPTILDILGFKMYGQPEPVDGVSLLPLFKGKMKKRPRPIGFQSAKQLSLTDNRYKIYSPDKGKTFMLFDLIEDPSETRDLAAQKPNILKSMKKELLKWLKSCQESLAGKDYK